MWYQYIFYDSIGLTDILLALRKRVLQDHAMDKEPPVEDTSNRWPPT